ncbi:MAG TPA: hypothetical protein VM287_07190 [Egibacteraceae bacterium]|nr:hypothetical protein [Egibacteraceae bacterium]
MTQGAGEPAGNSRRPVRRPVGLRLSELLTVEDETDEEGRLLLEDSAPERAIRKAVRAGIAMETATCPYRDTPSRHGGRMNISAYEALRRDTAEVLAGLAWLGARYYEREPAARSTARGLTDLSKLGITLPLILFRRGSDPVARHGRLPSHVAAIFKASRGMFSAAFDMQAKVGPEQTTAHDVVRFAESESHFKRPATGTVCAAPTRLIERTVAVMLTATGADAEASRLGDLVAFDTLWNFFRVEKAFNQNLNQYGRVLEQVLAGGRSVEDRDLFDVPVRIGHDAGRFGDVTDAFLRYANQAQALLNRAVGRAENAPPLTFHDILRAL